VCQWEDYTGEATRKSPQELLDYIRSRGSIPEQVQQAFSARAELDVVLAEDTGGRITNLVCSLDRFARSMDRAGRKAFWLTTALFFVAAVQAAATAWPIISKWLGK
jgi:hypothetical protein